MSVYTGPGSYQDHAQYLKMAKRPTTALMKENTLLSKSESKK